MVLYTGTFTFGGVTLKAEEITVSKAPAKIRQKIGKNVAELPVVLDQQEYHISIRGYLVGADKDTNRASLEALDDADVHTYTDGHVSSLNMFIVPSTLVFTDTGDNVQSWDFEMELVEWVNYA